VSTGAASRSLPFRPAGESETVQGVFKQTVQLSSGKFALVENAPGVCRDFAHLAITLCRCMNIRRSR
jgi:transglutaminase-like putative cysteine protease